MIKNSKKNFITRILFNSKTFALIGLIIIILISIPLAKRVSQKYKIDQEIKDLEAEIADLENKNIDLKEFVNYLESDQFVEEQARLQFGLKKEGEEAAVIKSEEVGQSQERVEAGGSAVFGIVGLDKNQPAKSVSNPERWRGYFFD
ncbi:septum formation initiator family protein [Candidatus Parcubacteria bacterium]|nr:septum formation initiator family protein [Candidatus Parcubacteria bacterium]